MGLGCWLDIESSEPQKSLQCTTWHGKPHELNICFVLDKDSSLEFVFDPSTDRLTIDIIEGDAVLKPVSSGWFSVWLREVLHVLYCKCISDCF